MKVKVKRMYLAYPSMITDIDKYAEEKLGIPTAELMRRAGHAVADAVRVYAERARPSPSSRAREITEATVTPRRRSLRVSTT